MQVEKNDVVEAFRLLEVAMQQSATDHSTGNSLIELSLISYFIFCAERGSNDCLTLLVSKGTIDMDLITTGVSASERMRRENLVSATRNIIMEKMQLQGPSMRLMEVC